ncbi:hypothetical protein NBRGN_035_00540 [Nocardia brasiliensis NBRC 14402]|uniref:hypothetical protein n=1 Tax=Nocardia brasiliensis TaxID=37326 RepID=UPI000313CC40|nr:hypothetical protein [Nocardia brasiliensis]GAJ81150.1 hypothetical protein NBRGN_035_00540 [Nocardia brasiliensis NBRC 14402]SUB40530.1 Uncharacterised protein [Nocardia brasiliensis]
MNGDRSTGFFGRVTGRGAGRAHESADAREQGGPDESAGGRGQRGANEPRSDAEFGRTDRPDAHSPLRSPGDDTDPPDLGTGRHRRDTRREADRDRATADAGNAGNDTRTSDQGAAHSDAQPKNGPYQGDPGDGLAEFAAELKLLAEAVLERVEPVLRRAADGQVEWSSCDWCPVCAAAALVRGEHHEVLQSVADHGTAIVTVLREALAGVPVDPVMPEHDHAAPHRDSTASPHDATAGRTEGRAGQRPSRSRYVPIPVTIKA